MDTTLRIKYALEHIEGRSVVAIKAGSWRELVVESGDPTKLIKTPKALGGLMNMAAQVITVGSGIINPDPGIDVVRHDPRDAPYVYNIDHYTVIENLPLHPQYHRVLEVAAVEENNELNSVLAQHVYVVGPYRRGDHWVQEIPERIRDARTRKRYDSGQAGQS
jgi:hypothetical protein